MPRRPQARVRQPYRNQKLESALQARYGRKSLRDWAKLLSAEQGVSVTHGTLHRALQGVEPRRPELRQVLGFAPLVVIASPCPHCGEAHESDVCTHLPPAGAADVLPVTVWARRVRAGAVVLGRSRRCRRGRCGVHFVGAPGQRYCSQSCAERAARSRRQRSR